MSALKFVLFLGTVREGRNCTRVGNFIKKHIEAKNHEVVVFGPGGGSTARMQLRYFLGEIGMVTPRFMFMIPVVHESFAKDGTPDPSNDTAILKSDILVSELEWYAEAQKYQREKNGFP